MSKIYNFFRFWLCVMTIGGILSFGSAFAAITITEEVAETRDYPTVVIRFDSREDIMNLNSALSEVFRSLKLHKGSVMCPYESFREIISKYFGNEVGLLVLTKESTSEQQEMVSKLCNILTGIILKSGTISECGNLKVILCSYDELNRLASENISNIVQEAYRISASGIRIVYHVGGGYKLEWFK